jgi:hypothetical protein
MELGGNLNEHPVTIGNTSGRAFTDVHGNGVLAANGDPNGATWPATTTAVGTGFRGGDYLRIATEMRVSDRTSSIAETMIRYPFDGGRGVRSMP